MDTQNNTSGNEQSVPQDSSKVQSNASNNKKLWGILSYLGVLVIIPLLVKKEDTFIKFHIKQGLVLLSIQIIIWILKSMFMAWSLWPIFNLASLVIFVLSILGIINVIKNREKELPFVGEFAKYFTI